MNNKEKTDISEIAKHIHILNDEVGNLQSDVKWMKRLGYYMASVMTAIGLKLIIFTGG